MKKYLMFLMLLVLLPTVLAKENSSESPGVTPDSFLWGVDRALEQISLLLATNPEAKAVKGLEIARERLLEVKAMAEARNLPALEKAQSEHSKVLLKVKEQVKLLSDDDPEKQLEKELEIEEELEEHETEIEEVVAKLKIKIKIEGQLTEEQQAKLDEFLASLNESAEDLRVEIKSKESKTIIRIKETTGKSEQEIEEKLKRWKQERELEEKLKVRAEIEDGVSVVKVDRRFETNTTDREALLTEIVDQFFIDAEMAASLLKVEEDDENESEAEEAEDREEAERLQVKVKMENDGSEVRVKLRFSLNSTDRGQIIAAIAEKTKLTAEQITAVWQLKEEKLKEEEEKEIEIEVEIEEGEAEVEIKTDGSKMEFVLQETDREKIIQEIALRLGISLEDVLKFVTFEEEKEEEDEEESEMDDDEKDESSTNSGSSKGSGDGNGGDD